MTREPVAQAVNYIIVAMGIIARMAVDPADYDEVADEEGALWTIRNQAEWILSYINERNKEKAKAEWLLSYIDEQKKKKPDLRVVK